GPPDRGQLPDAPEDPAPPFAVRQLLPAELPGGLGVPAVDAPAGVADQAVAGAVTQAMTAVPGRRHAPLLREDILSWLSLLEDRGVELSAGGDPELGEDLPQVPFHGARAQVELEPDLGVRQSFAGEPGDLRLLLSEIVRPFRGLRPDLLPGGRQLAPRAPGKRFHPYAVEHPERLEQFVPGVYAPVDPAQPFAVNQVGARQLRADAGAVEPLDRFAVERLGRVVGADQRLRASPHARSPAGVAGPGHLLQARQGVRGTPGRSGAGRRLDKLGQPLGDDGDSLVLEGVGG